MFSAGFYAFLCPASMPSRSDHFPSDYEQQAALRGREVPVAADRASTLFFLSSSRSQWRQVSSALLSK
jgi:hypothetical protein